MSATIGETIKRIRKSLGLTQTDVAERLFTTPQNISRVESGEGEPTAEMLVGLSKLFEVSVDALVGHDRLSDRELMEQLRGYLRTADGEDVAEKTFTACRAMLDGRVLTCFEASQVGRAPTYSTVRTPNLRAVYSDKPDRPRLFAAVEATSVQVEGETMARMIEVFRALTDPAVYAVMDGLSRRPELAKEYDKSSFCTAFGVEERNFDGVIASLRTLALVTETELSLNGASITLYRPRMGDQAVLLLTLADRLYRGTPDGMAH